LQGSAAKCDAACSRTFRLCIICPAQAVVIIDGKKTQTKGDVREFCLKLPADIFSRPADKRFRYIEVYTLVNNDQKNVRREKVKVIPDGSQVLIVP
jgi:hypothetical protein